MSPRTSGRNPERISSSRNKNDARPKVNSNVTMTAAVHKNHSRLSILPMLVPIVSGVMPGLASKCRVTSGVPGLVSWVRPQSQVPGEASHYGTRAFGLMPLASPV